MIPKRPESFEVGDLVRTIGSDYWIDSHFNKIAIVTQIDWGLELLAVHNPYMTFNTPPYPYHQFRYFTIIKKWHESKLIKLAFS